MFMSIHFCSSIESLCEISEDHTYKICQLFHLDIPSIIFESNLQTLGIKDDIFLFKVINGFSLWGAHEALKLVLKNKYFMTKAFEEYNGLLNVVILLTSPTLGEHSIKYSSF